MRDASMGTRTSVVLAPTTVGDLVAGVGVTATPAGASAHAAARIRRAATALDLSDLTMNTWYTCVGPCASAIYGTGYGVARSGVTIVAYSGAWTSGAPSRTAVQSHRSTWRLRRRALRTAATQSTFRRRTRSAPQKTPNVSRVHGLFSITGGTAAEGAS